jgi:hypothetical protein
MGHNPTVATDAHLIACRKGLFIAMMFDGSRLLLGTTLLGSACRALPDRFKQLSCRQPDAAEVTGPI